MECWGFDFAVIQAKNLEHWLLIKHGNNAVRRLRFDFVMAEIESVKSAQFFYGVDHGTSTFFIDFELFNLDVL